MLHWLPRNSSGVQKVVPIAFYRNEVHIHVLEIYLEDTARLWKAHPSYIAFLPFMYVHGILLL